MVAQQQTWLRHVWLMAWQIRLSVVCDVRVPYSGGLTFPGYFLHHIVAWLSGNSPTKNHEDRPTVQGYHPNRGVKCKG